MPVQLINKSSSRQPQYFMEQQALNSLLAVLIASLVLLSRQVACDTYYILTSPSSSCPGELTGEPCLTLQQFASRPDRSSSVLLMMEAGSHTLNSTISLSNIYNFTMAPLVPNSSVRIVCGAQSNASGSFSLTAVSFVQLQGVSIEGCTYSNFGTNGDSVLMNAVSFSNLRDGGILIRNISNRVQLHNVTFTNSDITEIDTMPTTLIQMRDVVFTSGRSISIGPAAEFSIEDSTFQGGSASALYLYNITQGTVVRCHFHSNNRYEERAGNTNGGALSVLYSASVTVNESVFYANSADGIGGDIYGNSSNVVIDRSTFTASSRSGVYVYKVNLTVMNSNFSDSSAISGTSINAVRCPRLQIIACTFANNIALNVYDDIWYGNGGALRTYLCATVLISNSHFTNNTAVYGGAILCHDSDSFTITDCSFSSNIASHDEGGAMRVYASHVTLLHSVFDGNSASTKGGAVYVTGTVTANWTNFTNNRADSGGALYVYAVDTQLFVSHGYFRNNTASNGSGGAIFNDGQTDTNVSLVDSTFEYNFAASCGVLNIDIYIFHSILNVIRSTFSHNMATGQSSIGGGVICIKDASISVADSTFSHNSAALHAGVMYVDDSVLIVERSSFVSNSADGNGGVMYTNTSSTNYTVILSNFVHNTAGDSGGVMFIGTADSQVSIRRSSCSYNNAMNRGGVIAIVGSNLTIDETNIFNNTARLGGTISACNSDVTVPSELAATEDSPTDSECILYRGYINHFNFIHQDVSTTSSTPVTTTTTTSSTTKNTFATTTQTESTTTGMTPSTENLITTIGSQTASPITSSRVSQPMTKNGPTTSTSRSESPTTDRGTPNTPYTTILTTTTDASLTNSTENGQPMTNSTKIAIIIAVSCITIVVAICVSVLVGVYVTIKITDRLKRRSEYRYSLHNDNEFLMEEAE